MNQRQKKKMMEMKIRQIGDNVDEAKELKASKRDLGSIEIKSLVNGDKTQKSYILSFSSEDPYCRYFWNDQKKDYEYLPEILSHEEGAINYDRLKNLGTVLFNHNADVPIGHISEVSIQGKRGIATIEFGTDEESQKYKAKVDSGVLKGVSVGYVVNKYDRVKNFCEIDGKKFDAMVARKWTIHEISIVSIPADATVGVGRELNIDEIPNYSLYEKQIEINKNKIKKEK